MGDIVVFGRDDRRVGGAAGAIVGGAGGFAGGSKSDAKAVVVLDYRMVDAETSEVVGSGEARGESKRTSKGFGAAMFAGGVVAGGGINMTSSNFAETIIGEATMDAVNKLSQQIAAGPTTGSASSRENDLDALVADVSGTSLTINAGSGGRPGRGPDLHHLSQGQGNQGSPDRRSAGRADHADRHADHHRGSRSYLYGNIRCVRRRRSRSWRRRKEVGRPACGLPARSC